MRFTCMGMNVITHLVLELGCRREINEYVMFKCVSLVRFGSSPVIHYSFLAIPSQYDHQCQYTPFTLRSCESTGLISGFNG